MNIITKLYVRLGKFQTAKTTPYTCESATRDINNLAFFRLFKHVMGGHCDKLPCPTKDEMLARLKNPDNEEFVLSAKQKEVACNISLPQDMVIPYFSDGSAMTETHAYLVACLNVQLDQELHKFIVTDVESVMLCSTYHSHQRCFGAFKKEALSKELQSFPEEKIFGEVHDRLFRAVAKNDVAEVTYLLSSYRAEVRLNNVKKVIYLSDEIQQQHPQIARKFSNNGRYVGNLSHFHEVENTNVSPILFRAVLQAEPNPEIIQLLVHCGASPELEIKGLSAKVVAAWLGNEAVIAALGETPNVQNNEGGTEMRSRMGSSSK